MSKERIESDTMGEIKVPETALWGAQTQRSLENFKIGSDHFSKKLIRNYILLKKAAAKANLELGKITKEKAELIIKACEELYKDEKVLEHFPLVVWQTGSGTQTNMNTNEVIANKCNQLKNLPLGSKDCIHPNNDVNMSQSSNDSFPTAMHLSALDHIDHHLMPALMRFQETLKKKMKEFEGITKIGRTHFMDATPIQLSQEFSGYLAQLEDAKACLNEAKKEMLRLPIGGTAVGTGLNSHPDFANKVCAFLSEETQWNLTSSENKFSGLSCHDNFVTASGALKRLAGALMKIASDIRIMGSGPRCGFSELKLPANEPGSSIMPGKVNPTQCEALIMVGIQVQGLDSAISMAASQGILELNVCKPLIIHNFEKQAILLGDAMDSFNEKCLKGLSADTKNIQTHLENSLMLVTALNQHIGYDSAAKIAKYAFEKDLSLREAAIELDILSGEKFDELVVPEEMTHP